MFLIKKRRSADAHYWTVLYQTDKSSHQTCSIKKAVHKNVAIFKGKHLATLLKKTPTQMFFCEFCEISDNNSFEEHLSTAASEVTLWSNCLGLSLDSRFQNHPDSVILQRYHMLSNQSFKHNSAHMTPLKFNSYAFFWT